MAKLTKAQQRALERYEHAGLSAQILCGLATFKSLISKGLLSRSHGSGLIEAEITSAGRLALQATLPAKENEGHG